MGARAKELYGSMVFNEHVMKERLPSATFKSIKATIDEGKPLNLELANVVASVMKDWAIEKGATHFTHWFQPLTGITSEKHDSFIAPLGDGTAIMSFSGKELIQGEPDASSFPSGGLRATCEARGYTAWDPTSFAFVKDGTLCIPTAFCSYTGEALDKKTPLLRSMKAISQEACKVLRLFGKNVEQVTATVGPEQEYFLIRKEDYARREDLIITGRTLFGHSAAKGQELEEHYFGALRPQVAAFMKDLDEELWKLGIPAKTEHNEVAPAQHELAPLYDAANKAIDYNLLTMEYMKKVADRHGFVCLLHEKPFDGINGSGKHDNWSLSAGGENLLDPGDTPMDNLQFLTFLTAVIKAVDEYQDLLRATVATPGNDHRLGANEAPPAIVSIFVGDELGGILDAIVGGETYEAHDQSQIDLGADVLPVLPKDTTDRNRTSPFAFTGNKFEFRMPGSSINLADVNTVLNTAVAKVLKDFSEEMEGKEDFTAAAAAWIRRTIRKHQRILFNGDGYTAEWEQEAARRGLGNYKTAVEALPHMLDEKNIALMSEMNVLSPVEMKSRCEVELEHYSKVIHIEALTSLGMTRRSLIPAAIRFMGDVAETAARKKAVSAGLSTRTEEQTLQYISRCTDEMNNACDKLEQLLQDAEQLSGSYDVATCYCRRVLPAMKELRAAADNCEILVGRDYWPIPNYSEMLFYI